MKRIGEEKRKDQPGYLLKNFTALFFALILCILCFPGSMISVKAESLPKKAVVLNRDTTYIIELGNTSPGKVSGVTAWNNSQKSETAIFWSVRDKGIASLQKAANGMVKVVPKKTGVTYIKAVTKEKSCICKIKIAAKRSYDIPYRDPYEQFNIYSRTLFTYNEILNIDSYSGNDVTSLFYTRANAPQSLDGSIKYKSSNSKVLQVQGGRIYRKGTGSATLTMTAGSFKSSVKCTVVDTSNVSVSDPPDKILVGDSFRLSLNNVSPGLKVTWKSDDPGIAKIKANGNTVKVTAKKAGSIYISAHYANSSFYKHITIDDKRLNVSTRNIDNIFYMTDQSDSDITWRFSADTNIDGNVKWSSDNPKVLKVENNKIYMVGKGTANITASVGSMKKSIRCTVVDDTKVGLANDYLNVFTGDVFTLKLKNASKKDTVQWSSSNINVVTVKGAGTSATVTCKAKGNAKISAIYHGNTYSCSLYVTDKYLRFTSESGYELELKDGFSLDVSSTIYANTNAENPVTYTSSNSGVIKIENNKPLLAGPGEAVITASVDALKVSVTCKVTDKRELEGKTLNIVLRVVSGNVGDKFASQYNVCDPWQYVSYPNEIKKVTSQNPEIAEVEQTSERGFEMKGKKIGTTKITVETKYRTFSFTLNVIPFRSDEDLSKEYDGFFAGWFGVRYENSIVMYHGRIAETKDEFRVAITSAIRPAREFYEKYLSSGMNDFQKVAAIFRYYKDNNIRYGSSENTLWSFYGMLYVHEAVCEGACEATAMLARLAGLDVYRCSSNEKNHSWNMVKADGKWYEIDFNAPGSGKWGDQFYMRAVNITGDTIVDEFVNVPYEKVEDVTNADGTVSHTTTVYGTDKISLPIPNTSEESLELDVYGNILRRF